MNWDDYYRKQAQQDRKFFRILVSVFLCIVAVPIVACWQSPTLAERVAECRAACSANGMIMKGYSTGKYGGCSCEVSP